MKYKLRSLENNMEESGDTNEREECTYAMVIGENEVNVEDDGSGKDKKNYETRPARAFKTIERTNCLTERTI